MEGILELANDQIAPVSYVTGNIDRNPTPLTTSGNNVWVNGQQYGSGSGSWSLSNSPVGSTIGNGLGNVYAGTSAFTLGSSSNPAPSFDMAGNNTSLNSQGISGQNAIQMAVADVIPAQAFVSTSSTDNAAHPWLRTPSDAGYGTGNTSCPPASVGHRQFANDVSKSQRVEHAPHGDQSTNGFALWHQSIQPGWNQLHQRRA